MQLLQSQNELIDKATTNVITLLEHNIKLKQKIKELNTKTSLKKGG